jgi:ABC-type sugar transport system substrate-binding protein
MGIFTLKGHLDRLAGRLTIMALAAGLAVTAAAADEESSPPKPLTHALQLADLNNWPDAQPEFRKAEDVFRKSGDRLGVLYAQLGIIRATAQHRNLPETVAQLDHMLATEPLLQTDRHLRLFFLTIRGDFDGEMKSSAMRKDW